MPVDLSVIVGQFGLTLVSVRPIPHAVLSQVYVVNDQYILRSRTLEQEALQRFDREQKLLQTVRDIVPIQFPQLLTTRDGKNYFREGQTLWTVYPLIEGDILCAWWNLEKLSPPQAKTTFTTLRQLHLSTMGRLAAVDIRAEYNFLYDVRARLSDSRNDITSSEYGRVEQSLEKVDQFTQGLLETDLCFVHGDYHPGNVLFKGDRVVALLDTDWSRKASFLEDLAYTVMMFLRDYTQENFHFDQQKYTQFLNWYGLPESSRSIFKEYLLLYTFYDTHLFRDLTSLPNHDKIFRFQKQFLAEICANYS